MTEVEFSRMLSELSESASALNKESDSINGIIERFQEKLVALNVGIEVSVKLEKDLGTLSWWKMGDTWQVTMLWGTVHIPLLEQPREVRIAALKKFPDLVQQLKWKADEALSAIKQAKDYVK